MIFTLSWSDLMEDSISSRACGSVLSVAACRTLSSLSCWPRDIVSCCRTFILWSKQCRAVLADFLRLYSTWEESLQATGVDHCCHWRCCHCPTSSTTHKRPLSLQGPVVLRRRWAEARMIKEHGAHTVLVEIPLWPADVHSPPVRKGNLPL